MRDAFWFFTVNFAKIACVSRIRSYSFLKLYGLEYMVYVSCMVLNFVYFFLFVYSFQKHVEVIKLTLVLL